jgi:hypothetical protein
MIIAVAVTGCFGGPETDDDETARHENDAHQTAEHFVPDHWPADLPDAAAKVAQRASALAGPSCEPSNIPPGESRPDDPVADRSPMIEKELRDIVGWVPEIAADTPLTEAQWMVVYEASESLSKRLRKIRRPLDDETLGVIDGYRGLLVKTAKMLGEDSQ